MEKKIERSYIREILDAIDEDTISFAGGLPKDELLPNKEIYKASKKALKNKKALQYSSSYGICSLRQKIADLYTKKLNFQTSEDEILIVSGSQQAFDIILKAISLHKVIVESPSYLGALGSFKILNKKIVSFTKIKDLKKKLDKNSLLYVISDFQNPSTSSYNKKQREKFSKYINKKESFLIEDGAYCFLSFNGKYKTPISKSCENSFHLGSFSKILAPGLRVGWIRANKELVDKLVVIKESLDLQTATFNQMIIDEYLNKNDIFSHIKMINSEYKKRMEFMCNCFDKYIPRFKYKKPKGGMFIYGSFENDSMALAKKALNKNIVFVPAQVFYLNKKSKEARFNFTNTSYKEIEKGIKTLSSLV